jgi:hypothetical protein
LGEGFDFFPAYYREQVRQYLRLPHYSIHSERFYANWIVRFIRFRHMRSRDAFRLNSK